MNFKGVNTATWVRIVVLFILLVNQVTVSFFGFQLVPFNDEDIYEGVSTSLTVLGALWVSWKNNSFTEEAQQADRYLKALKKGDSR